MTEAGPTRSAGRDDVRPSRLATLSEREREVARLLAVGHTNAEIAQLLAVSVRTVESHRGHVFDKLGVRTRAELVRTAVETGLVDLSSP